MKTLYPYQGHGLDVKKGEVIFLLEKTNLDWFNIWKNNGDNGYVPANYIKEIDHKIVSEDYCFQRREESEEDSVYQSKGTPQ